MSNRDYVKTQIDTLPEGVIELNDGYSEVITVDKQADSVDFALMENPQN
jgi:hypothetical protein